MDPTQPESGGPGGLWRAQSAQVPAKGAVPSQPQPTAATLPGLPLFQEKPETQSVRAIPHI